MIEHERRHFRRREDRALRWIRAVSRLLSAGATAFAAGVAAIITIKQAWLEVIKAFWGK